MTTYTKVPAPRLACEGCVASESSRLCLQLQESGCSVKFIWQEAPHNPQPEQAVQFSATQAAEVQRAAQLTSILKLVQQAAAEGRGQVEYSETLRISTIKALQKLGYIILDDTLHW